MPRCESDTDDKLLLCRERMAKLSSDNVRVALRSEGLPRQDAVGFVQFEAMLNCMRGDTRVVRMACAVHVQRGNPERANVRRQLTAKESLGKAVWASSDGAIAQAKPRVLLPCALLGDCPNSELDIAASRRTRVFQFGWNWHALLCGLRLLSKRATRSSAVSVAEQTAFGINANLPVRACGARLQACAATCAYGSCLVDPASNICLSRRLSHASPE